MIKKLKYMFRAPCNVLERACFWVVAGNGLGCSGLFCSPPYPNGARANRVFHYKVIQSFIKVRDKTSWGMWPFDPLFN